MKKFYVFGAAALALCAISCNKENNGPDTPNGKPEINVAKEALVAYLPFENEAAGTTGLTLADKGKTTEANFVEGRTGKCFQGGENQYLIYNIPADSPIRTMKGFTYSAWVNQPEIPQSQAPVPMYFQLANLDKDTPDHFWGNIAFAVDRTEEGAGYLTYKTCFRHGQDGAIWKTWNGDYGECFPAGRWNHLVFSYNNETSEFHVYVNGADVTPESAVACVMGEKPAGDLEFIGADQIVIGAWLPKILDGATDEWMGWMEKSQIDEFRLYSRALTTDEVSQLYRAEVANINE